MYTTKIEGFQEDAVRVTKNHTQLCGLFIDDTLVVEDLELAAKAHRDGIQLIPAIVAVKEPKYPALRPQYIGGCLSHVSISDTLIQSPGHLQPVFCSDGLLHDLRLNAISYRTKSQHGITLNGLLNGKIDLITSLNEGALSPNIQLSPLRLGGSIDGVNLWVMSFADSENYWYDPIKAIIGHEYLYQYGMNGITDRRFEPWTTKDIYLVDFDLAGFQEDVLSVPTEIDVALHCERIKAVALNYGDLL